MLSQEEALGQIAKSVPRLGEEVVALASAVGRTLAEEIVAAEDVPSFTRSAMDGFAVQSADIAAASSGSPATLKLTGTVPAGSVNGTKVERGTAVRIFTGGMIPAGADAVVMQEDCDVAGDSVSVKIK